MAQEMHMELLSSILWNEEKEDSSYHDYLATPVMHFDTEIHFVSFDRKPIKKHWPIVK